MAKTQTKMGLIKDWRFVPHDWIPPTDRQWEESENPSVFHRMRRRILKAFRKAQKRYGKTVPKRFRQYIYHPTARPRLVWTQVPPAF